MAPDGATVVFPSSRSGMQSMWSIVATADEDGHRDVHGLQWGDVLMVGQKLVSMSLDAAEESMTLGSGLTPQAAAGPDPAA